MLPLLPRCRHPLRHGTLGQQHLLGALANKSTTVHPASVSSKAPLPAASCSAASCSVASCSVASSSQQQLSHHGAPASNKPHLAEKSTPAWLAIWHIWAGFANSQLRCAIFQSNYSCKCPSPLLPPWSCCSDRRKSFGPSAPIAYATSVSPPNKAAAWPGCRYPMDDEDVAWPVGAGIGWQ